MYRTAKNNFFKIHNFFNITSIRWCVHQMLFTCKSFNIFFSRWHRPHHNNANYSAKNLECLNLDFSSQYINFFNYL